MFNKGKPLAVLAAALAIFLLLVSWSLTTPVGGYPDDSFHFANIWCDEGLSGYVCEDVEGGLTRLVPNVFTEGSPWWEATGRGENNQLWEDAYPTLYYAAMKPMADENVVTSVLLMRLVNISLAVSLMCFALVLVPRRLLFAFGLSWLAGGVALGFYYLASSHPFSWFYLGAGTLWVFVAAFLESRQLSTRLSAVACGAFAAAITVGSRPEGVFALLLALFLGMYASFTDESRAFIKRSWRQMSKGLRIVLPILSGSLVFATAYLIYTRSSVLNRLALDGLRNRLDDEIFGQLIDASHLYLYVIGSNARITEDGFFGPQSMFLVVAVSSVATWGLLQTFRFKWLVSSCLFLVALFVPLGVQVDERGILYTPPRYLAVYLMLLLASLLLADDRNGFGIKRSPWRFIAILLMIGHSLALHSAIRPYSVGYPPPWQFGLNSGMKWWWSVGPSPQTVWLVGSVCFGVLLYLLGRSSVLTSERAG